MKTMKYGDKKKLVEKLAEYFYNYKGLYYYPRYVELSEHDELLMFYMDWIQNPKAFEKVLEMLEYFENSKPEEASKVFNEFITILRIVKESSTIKNFIDIKSP